MSSLRRTDVQWDEQTRREFIAEIDLETDRLTELVNSLLAARASRAGAEPAPDMAFTEPATVIEGALNQVGLGLLGRRPLRIDVPSSLPSVQMNASQMERVLVNLVENAIKYSPSGTPIGISARVTGDRELQISVEDEGPGVPAAHRERIFEPFFRNQMARTSNVPGHGLGLAICQSIVLAHGGRIEVNDRPGRGACFSVFLPAPAQAGTRSGRGFGNIPLIQKLPLLHRHRPEAVGVLPSGGAPAKDPRAHPSNYVRALVAVLAIHFHSH